MTVETRVNVQSHPLVELKKILFPPLHINTRLARAVTATDRLSVIWKSDLTNKIKRSFFFQAVVVTILLYGCTT